MNSTTNDSVIDLMREVAALKTERDALRAEIDALMQQEPVMWANSANIASAKINQERGGIGDQHTCTETRTTYHDAPLYALPGASSSTSADFPDDYEV